MMSTNLSIKLSNAVIRTIVSSVWFLSLFLCFFFLLIAFDLLIWYKLAIQNNLITKYEDSAKTAEETVKFFDTITNMVGKSKITD